MTKFMLNPQDNIRGHKAAILGALLAVGISALVIFIGFYGSTVPFVWEVVLIYCPSAGLATWLSVRFFWKRLIRKGENQQRGALYGGLAGLCALLMMSLILVIGGLMLSLLAGGMDSQSIAIETIMSTLLIFLALIFYSFIFGGFLAPIIGAIAGHFLTIDPEYMSDYGPE